MNEQSRSIPEAPPDAGRFDPDSAERSWTLPALWYRDPDIHRREQDAIFARTWQYLCHLSDVAVAGDFHAGRAGEHEVFVIRGRDGELRGFHNVCSHRAHPLLEGEGNTRVIVCPYHQWCYETDGGFRGARGRERLQNWTPAEAHLKPVRVELWGGFVFVNLDLEARPLAGQAGKLLESIRAACPALERLVRARRYDRAVAANWKTVVDNNHECYHCAANHPSLMELIDYRNEAVWSDDGITFTHAVRGESYAATAYLGAAGATEQGSLFGYVWPNAIPLLFPGTPSLLMFQVLPTGPETCVVRHDFYFRNREPSTAESEFVRWIREVLSVEDIGICECVQRGLRSRAYTQGKLVVDRAACDRSEHHLHFFQRHVHAALTGG